MGNLKCIEDNIHKIELFDYAVFDEIHNLDKEDDGNIYENLIKLLNYFLALSATIGNIEYLKVFLRKLIYKRYIILNTIKDLLIIKDIFIKIIH